jgi:hypothetical protein
MGSDGRAVVGMPSSSTEGGIMGSANICFSSVSSRRRRMGGGAASSSSDEDEDSLLDGEGGSSWSPNLE